MNEEPNQIDKFWQDSHNHYEQEKAAEKRARIFGDQFDNDTLPHELQEVKNAASAIVKTAPDKSLIDWGDFMAEVMMALELPIGMYPSKADSVILRLIGNERDRRGLPDPDDYINPDEERWNEILADLPYDATPDEISEALLDIENNNDDEFTPDDMWNGY